MAFHELSVVNEQLHSIKTSFSEEQLAAAAAFHADLPELLSTGASGDEVKSAFVKLCNSAGVEPEYRNWFWEAGRQRNIDDDTSEQALYPDEVGPFQPQINVLENPGGAVLEAFFNKRLPDGTALSDEQMVALGSELTATLQDAYKSKENKHKEE